MGRKDSEDLCVCLIGGDEECVCAKPIVYAARNLKEDGQPLLVGCVLTDCMTALFFRF
jgi:hypothetical protein